jgi:hypothetical protein
VRRFVFNPRAFEVTVPSVMRASSMPRNPEIARRVVVFPAPFVPRIVTICLSPTDNVTPCTAVMTRL